MSKDNPNEIIHGPIMSEGLIGRKCIRQYHNGNKDTHYIIRGVYVKTTGFDDRIVFIVEDQETSTVTNVLAHQVKLLPIEETIHE